MSLQVWLPLNGDLKNYGISTSNGNLESSSIIYEDGKIGKALRLNNYGIPGITFSNIIDKDKWSICFWLKLLSSDPTPSYENIITIDMNNNGAITGSFRIEHRNAAGQFQIVTPKLTTWGGNTNTYYTFYSNNDICSNKWGHLVITNDGTNYKTYINGALVSTCALSIFTETTSKLRGGVSFGMTGTYASLNDFRIYDEILSPKQIKEISKGLVLHLPCDGGGRGTNNLVNGSNTNSVNTNGFGYSEQTGGSTRTIEYDGGIPCVKITRNTTAHSGWDYFWYNKLRISDIKENTTYTISFDAIASGSGTIGLSGFLRGNGTNSITQFVTTVSNSFNANGWSHIQFITTTKASFDGISVGSQVVYMSCGFLRTASTWVKLKNMKVVEGTVDSSWMPSVSDTAYTKMGYDKTTEYDISGYGNHGTKNGTISYVSDTPRYSVATVFDGTSSGIEIQSSVFPVVLNGPFTASMWVYDQETGGRSIFFGNWNLTGAFFNIEKEGSNKARFYWSGNPDFHCTNSPIAANAWTHLVMTRDGNTVKCYINGVLTDTSTAILSGTVPTNATIFRLGRDGRSDATMFKGYMSDFRLYATALTADDVKELYQVSASIDNNGNVFCSDIQEV